MLSILLIKESGNRFSPALFLEPFNCLKDRSRVSNDDIFCPGNDRRCFTSHGVASSMGQTILGFCALFGLGFGVAVGTWTKVGIHRKIGIDGLIAQPTDPVISVANFI